MRHGHLVKAKRQNGLSFLSFVCLFVFFTLETVSTLSYMFQNKELGGRVNF